MPSNSSNGVKLVKELRIEPGTNAKLAKRDPRATPGVKDAETADQRQDENVERLRVLQDRLWADNRRAILIVLQGMDTSGKDGTVRHLLTGVNPMGVHVRSFGAPTKEELDHDYLWRVHNAVPAYGTIGVFNRSHYEDVLIVRVHGWKSAEEIKRRYAQINRFEQHLSENGYTILKFMLHISKEEQAERLRERVSDPKKNWKMNLDDLKEREHWDEYMEAYEDAVNACSTAHAPWHVIPADRKWYRNYAISQIVADTMETLKTEYPKPTFDPKSVKIV